MVDAEYLLFCAGKSADENGNLSLHGIFDRLYANEFPTAHRPFKAVFKLTALKPVVDKTLTMRITLNLKNTELVAMEGEIKTTIEKGNAIVPDVDLSQFAFPEPGMYTLKLFVDEKLLIERHLEAIALETLTEK